MHDINRKLETMNTQQQIQIEVSAESFSAWKKLNEECLKTDFLNDKAEEYETYCSTIFQTIMS